jgi:phosphatidylglycerophosphate synthase
MYVRLFLGFVIVLLSYFRFNSFRFSIVVLIVIGILTDIFDGIIARKFEVSTQKLRRLDSTFDQVFWICTLTGAYLICPEFFRENYFKLSLVLGLEVVAYAVSYIKFKKEVATHAFLSKIWTVAIMATLIQIILSCNSLILFNVCIYFGIVSRIEIIAILLTIEKWTNDVPSLYHAIQLRKGKTIKRHKLFNG